ncbi:MAG: putative salt-induced outer membrane protein [Puniceicoccaceae bacterium 5H]|nr:MAG: putative salt-induced outer membrane protein [Puniceicoccaceae bacterium 5H]
MTLPRHNLRSLLAASLFLGGLAGAQAAEVTLSNGDKLTGEVLRVEDDKIILLSPILGEIEIPDLGVTIVYGENETPVMVQPAEEPEPEVTPEDMTAAAVAAEEEAAPAVDPTSGAPIGEDEQKQLEEVWWHPNHLFSWLAPYYPFTEWDNSIDVGFKLENNVTDKTQILLAAETSRKFTDIELTLYGQYRYSEDHPESGEKNVTENQRQSYFRYRHDISDRLFFQSRTDYKSDEIAGIQGEYQQNVGVGYRWLDSEQWKASVTPSLGYQRRDYETLPTEDQFLGTLFQYLEYQISSRLKFKESATFRSNISNPEDYSFDFQASLENRLAAYLNMKIRYDFQYDQAVDGVVETDKQIINLTFGADF